MHKHQPDYFEMKIIFFGQIQDSLLLQKIHILSFAIVYSPDIELFLFQIYIKPIFKSHESFSFQSNSFDFLATCHLP